jgi:hypothetical protein
MSASFAYSIGNWFVRYESSVACLFCPPVCEFPSVTRRFQTKLSVHYIFYTLFFATRKTKIPCHGNVIGQRHVMPLAALASRLDKSVLSSGGHKISSFSTTRHFSLKRQRKLDTSAQSFRRVLISFLAPTLKSISAVSSHLMSPNPWVLNAGSFNHSVNRRFQGLGNRGSGPSLVLNNGGLGVGGLMDGALNRRASLSENAISLRNSFAFANPLVRPIVTQGALVRSPPRSTNIGPYLPHTQVVDPRLVALHGLSREQYNQQPKCNCNECLQCCYLHGYGPSSCLHQQNSCCSYDSCGCDRQPSYNTRDVIIRGKSRKIRASYLMEAGKFEADVVKYMDKKPEDVVPDRVIEMLVDYINHEGYTCRDLLDEVTLNILASNTGSKSAGDCSLGHVKKWDKKI